MIVLLLSFLSPSLLQHTHLLICSKSSSIEDWLACNNEEEKEKRTRRTIRTCGCLCRYGYSMIPRRYRTVFRFVVVKPSAAHTHTHTHTMPRFVTAGIDTVRCRHHTLGRTDPFRFVVVIPSAARTHTHTRTSFTLHLNHSKLTTKYNLPGIH